VDTPCFLVLDDESGVLESIDRLVKRRGLQVRLVTVDSARGADFVLGQHQPMAGMLLDVYLGDGNGFDVLERARKLPVHEDTPALMMSGAPDVSMFNRAYDLGAEMITKPFDDDLERVVRFLNRGMRPGADAAPLTPASTEVPPTLAGCIARLRELGRRYPDVRTRYLMGMIVAALKSRTRVYGPNAVSMAAREIGEDPPSLYRFSTVAERWTLAQFEELAARKGPDGYALKWSHFVFLASIASAPARERLVARTLAMKLCVRDLQEIAAAEGP
jgi:DNA-binding response OmpR family regulator